MGTHTLQALRTWGVIYLPTIKNLTHDLFNHKRTPIPLGHSDNMPSSFHLQYRTFLPWPSSTFLSTRPNKLRLCLLTQIC